VLFALGNTSANNGIFRHENNGAGILRKETQFSANAAFIQWAMVGEFFSQEIG
jgi:hypothetical protein